MKRIISITALVILTVALLIVATGCSTGSDCQHQWGEFTVAKAPDCSSGGYEIRFCSICGTDDRKVLSQTSHTFSDEWSVDGTYHWRTAICQHQGLEQDRGAHNFVDNMCTVCHRSRVTQGLEYRANLGEDTYNVVDIGQANDPNVLVGRTYNNVDIVGISDGAFSSCVGLITVYLQDNILTVGDRAFADNADLVEVQMYSSVEYIGSEIFADCTAEGFRVVFFGTREEWDAVEKAEDWDVGNSGYNIYIASLDGTVTETITVECRHQWSGWTEIQKPTCGAGGYSTRSCSRCEKSEREDLPALEHTFSDEWSVDGTYHWHAATCEHVNEISDIEEHSFVDNTCTVCQRSRVTQGLEYRGNLGENTYRVVGIGQALDANVLVGRTYNGYDIVAIGDGAFSDCDGLLSVYLQDNIVSVGDEAFANNEELEYIQIMSSVEYIGSRAFAGCSAEDFCVVFYGTRSEWDAIEKAADWDAGNTGYEVVIANLDGTVVEVIAK